GHCNSYCSNKGQYPIHSGWRWHRCRFCTASRMGRNDKQGAGNVSCRQTGRVRIAVMLLMIDNYDSFTYNLVQYFGELGEEIQVYRNDEIAIADIEAMAPSHIVISPGPCTPAEAGI